MFKTNSEKVFLVVMVIMSIVLFASLSGCAFLDKLRGNHGVPDMLIIPPDVTSEDVRG